MIEKFFRCTLLSDVVLNSKLATEGNMTTLDYIPGSNFLGIVAGKLYKELDPTDAYAIFHSGEVAYGDATISVKSEISYPVPFDFMLVKGEEKLGENQVYLQHLLTKDNHPRDRDENEFKKQLKQKRTGYITKSGKIINTLEKTFALKSAQDAEQRRSKEGAMFGFESLKEGQEFVFSINFKEEKYIDQVTKALTGRKRIGKSKTAQYGQVEINALDPDPEKISTNGIEDHTLVYVQSNLCVFDEFGQATFQPLASDLGLKGKIDWKKSSIRTHSYSSWNGQRNTTDSQRNCIAAGSVLYVNGGNEKGKKSVGAFQSEGLGRILVNPVFLKGNKDTAESTLELTVIKPNKENRSIPEHPKTILGKLLKRRYDKKNEELKLSKAIQESYKQAIENKHLKNITASQWGAIRAYASKTMDIEKLETNLTAEKTGYLKHGVAYDRIWGKNKEKPLEEFKKVMITAKISYKPTTFIAKFAAQMAKQAPKN